jgi:hypothetical protein
MEGDDGVSHGDFEDVGHLPKWCTLKLPKWPLGGAL